MRHALLALVAAAGAAAAALPARAAVIEEVAAQVNGRIITRSDLLERERVLVGQLSSRFVGDELDRELERMRGNLLTDMIRELILMQRAEILGLELEKVYQQALNQLKEQQGIKTNDDLDQVLKQEGISKEELRDTLLRFNVPDIMVNLEVRDKIAVTDEEVADYFQKNKETFRTEEQFTIREIVLTAEGRTPEELDALGARVLEELQAGAPFNELVIKHSQAPSRFKDGLMGPFKRGDLVRELEAAALALKPGEVSPAIRTRAGLHIVKLESHSEARDPDPETARGDIQARIKQEKFSEALKRYFSMLLETNRIKVHPKYKQYDQRS
ncbi:MAG TPA: peptidylprolyl isomerase [Candidatus Polarisedimenticolia bacterium]|nr:peptidylprolyl isomerase [Candidatus Polarisedimenticolia bacterium]